MACCWTGSTNFPCGTVAACDVGPAIRTPNAKRRVYHAVPSNQVVATGFKSSAYQAVNNKLINTAIQWHTQTDACSYTTAAPEAAILLEGMHMHRQPHHEDVVPNFILTPPPAFDTGSATVRQEQLQQHALNYEHRPPDCMLLGKTGAELQGVSAVEQYQSRNKRRRQKHALQTHPAIVTQAIKSCRTPSQLSSTVDQYRLQADYNAVHASAALTHLAQLSTRMPRPPSLTAHIRQHRHPKTSASCQMPDAWDFSAQLAPVLLCDVLERRGCLQPRQLSNVCWAIAKLQSVGWLQVQVAGTDKLLPGLEQGATPISYQHYCGNASHSQQQEQGTGQQSSQLYSMADVHSPLAWLAHAAGEQWSGFEPQELSSLAYSLAQLSQPPPSPVWLAGLLQQASSALPNMTPQGIANMLWALSHWLQYIPPPSYCEQGPADRHGCWQILDNTRCWQSCVSRDAQEPSNTQADAVHAGMERLLQQLWCVTASQLCAVHTSHEDPHLIDQQTAQDCHQSAHSRQQPWTAGSLAVVAWSLATMKVLPPTDWLTSWYHATFPLLTSLSTQDACSVSWAAARWKQQQQQQQQQVQHLNNCQGTHRKQKTEGADVENDSSQHAATSSQQCFHVPTAWHSRLSGRVSELLVQIANDGPVSSDIRSRHNELVAGKGKPVSITLTQSGENTASHAFLPPGSPAFLQDQQHVMKTAQHLVRPVAGMGASSNNPGQPAQQQQTCRRRESRPEDSVEQSSRNTCYQHAQMHHLSVSMLLWSAVALKLRLPASCRNTLMADMLLHAPRGKYTARDFLELLALEMSLAAGSSSHCNISAHSSYSGVHKHEGGREGKRQQQQLPLTTPIHTAPAPASQEGNCREAAGGQLRHTSHNRTAPVPATRKAELIHGGNSLRQSVYQLAWSAAHSLIHSQHDTADHQVNHSRVRLMQLVAQLPGMYLPCCRAAWRAARTVLPKAKKGCNLRQVSSSVPYTEQQAAQLLSALAYTGYRADWSDVCMLLFRALSIPVLSSPQLQHQGLGLGAQDFLQQLQHVSDVAWSAAHLARLSASHRWNLACNKEASAFWRTVHLCMLSLVEQQLQLASRSSQEAMSSVKQQGHQWHVVADAVPVLLWSLTDLTAAVVTKQNNHSNKGHIPTVSSQPPSSSLSAQTGGIISDRSQDPCKPTTLPRLSSEPGMVVRRGGQQPSSPDDLLTHVAGQWLIPKADLLRWFTVLEQLVPSITGRPLLLLLSWLIRLPARVRQQAEVQARLEGLLPPLIDRSIAILSNLSCGELTTLAAHMAWLVTRITSSKAGSGDSSANLVTFKTDDIDRADNRTCSSVSHVEINSTPSIHRLTTALEFAGEVRSAEMHRSEATKLGVALAKLRGLQESV